MMNKIFTIGLTGLVIIGMSGCVQRLGDFTVMSTKNMDIKRSLHTTDSSARLKGIDAVPYFLILWGVPNIEEAIDNAIEQSPNAVGLSNVTLKSFVYGILPFFATFGYEIEGDPVYEQTRR